MRRILSNEATVNFPTINDSLLKKSGGAKTQNEKFKSVAFCFFNLISGNNNKQLF